MLEAVADIQVLAALPAHVLSPIYARMSRMSTDDNEVDDNGLTRSASFSFLSKDVPTHTIKRTFSENVIQLSPDERGKPSDGMLATKIEVLRRASRKRRSVRAAKFSLSAEDEQSPERENRKASVDGDADKSLTRSVTGTIRSFARKSWMGSASRSNSPSNKEGTSAEKPRSRSPPKRQSLLPIPRPQPVASRTSSRSSHDEDGSVAKSPLGGPDLSAKAQPIRPLSGFLTRSKSQSSLKRISRSTSSISLRSKSSADSSLPKTSSSKPPPIPSSLSSDQLSNGALEPVKKRDPLYTVFRTLDSEYAGFSTKTTLQRVKAVRQGLLPFLTKYANHPSNKVLRAEELDRRVIVLNKWWMAVLDMLHGRSQQAITPTDRPSFLEAATLLMMRPEWRIPPIPIMASETPPGPSLKAKSTNSLESSESDLLVESIHQNVRNIFVQNLLSQMAFVVEKLSIASAPASVVSFCGKACAYAYFFAPGVADILCRLWHVTPGTLRRIFSESGVQVGDPISQISRTFASKLPPPVRSLLITTQASLGRHLQHKVEMPPGTGSLRWYGPWKARWAGTQSDLFFVFAKHFHLLLHEFLPDPLSPKEWICVPGVAAVHAQMLKVLESTLYRQPGPNNVETFAGTDLDNPDSSASMPMVFANATRSIAENRLIMLLKDILNHSQTEYSTLRQTFAASFLTILTAASKKVSMYNNDACFVLCDFLEEVLPVLSRHHQLSTMNWPFWTAVCKKMMQSETILTKSRVISFVYSTWSILMSTDSRKRELVLGWLLEPMFFDQHFHHWCPMVRSYFLRLLCWRLARVDDNATQTDVEILETLSKRLTRCWAHFQYMLADAEMRGLDIPSSSPCLPAPSRMFMIVRTDSQPMPNAPLSALEKFLPMSPPSSLRKSLPDIADISSKRRWNIFKGLNPFSMTSPTNNRPGEVTPPGSPDNKSLENVTDPMSTALAKSRPATPPHQAYSFRFALEWVDSRPGIERKNTQLRTPLLPPNAQDLLQALGKAVVMKPTKPLREDRDLATYSGRALAEWGLVLSEYKNFFARRKQEGVPKDTLVETPTMGVEMFKIFGGS